MSLGWDRPRTHRHWLGRESVETTQIYLDANLALKEEILGKTRPIQSRPGRYRPGDRLLNFLKGL